MILMISKVDHRTVGNRRSRLFSLLSVAVVGIVALLGCGKSSKMVSVQGSITYAGKAVTDGIINFLQAKSRPLGGGINSDGTYSVELPPGEYQVRIDAPAALPAGYKEGTPLPKLPPLVPEKYANFNTSGLVAKIEEQGSSQQVDFKLP